MLPRRWALESDVRFYRRRANEELAAAERAVTQPGRERRIQLAGAFLERLKAVEQAEAAMFDWSIAECSYPGHS